jgi:hypothetical protein
MVGETRPLFLVKPAPQKYLSSFFLIFTRTRNAEGLFSL